MGKLSYCDFLSRERNISALWCQPTRRNESQRSLNESVIESSGITVIAVPVVDLLVAAEIRDNGTLTHSC